MAMSLVVNPSVWSCHKCRDLSSNLLVSVDAFEVLANLNPSISANILISTIRQIIAKAEFNITKEEAKSTYHERGNNNSKDSPTQQQQQQQHENLEKVKSSGSTKIDVSSIVTTDHLSLDNDINVNPIGNQRKNLLQASSKQNPSSKAQKFRKRKRKGRPKGSKNVEHNDPKNGNSNVLPYSRRSARPQRSAAKDTCIDGLIPPSQIKREENSDSNSNSNANYDPRSRPRRKATFASRVKKPEADRPLATSRDFERTAEHIKLHKVDTDDGLFYYLHECAFCSREFSEKCNIQRHIVALHYDKKVVRNLKGRQTAIQNSSNVIRNNAGKLTVVRLRSEQNGTRGRRGRRPNYSNNGRNRPGRIQIRINSDSESESKTKIKSSTSNLKKLERSTSSRPRRQSGNRSNEPSHLKVEAPEPASTPWSTYSSSSATVTVTKPGLRSIPPNLTVRNPGANFDLEKALNVRVCVDLTPNLTNKRVTTTTTNASTTCGSNPNPQPTPTTMTNGLTNNRVAQVNGPNIKTEIMEASSTSKKQVVKVESSLSDINDLLRILEPESLSGMEDDKVPGEFGEGNKNKVENGADGSIDMLSVEPVLQDEEFPKLNYDAIDLIEMDVDTIMAMQL